MKKLLFAAAALLCIAAVVIAVGYETPQEHYEATISAGDTVGTVTISVSCAEIANNGEVGQTLKQNGLIPQDGEIVPLTSVDIEEGDTAFSVLERVLTERRIHFDYTTVSAHSAYVKGINNIYEYDCGDLSGWMYSVSGDFPTISSSEYILHDGDDVKWMYTCDLGRDVGDTYYSMKGGESDE